MEGICGTLSFPNTVSLSQPSTPQVEGLGVSSVIGEHLTLSDRVATTDGGVFRSNLSWAIEHVAGLGQRDVGELIVNELLESCPPDLMEGKVSSLHALTGR